MSEPGPDTLVLALGNDLLGDDGVGWVAARQLQAVLPASVEVRASAEAGLVLMELMSGYERVLLLDAVMSGRCPPGTLLEFGPEDLGRVVAPSPHYAGLPEVLDLAARLGIPFPSQVRVLALEVEEPRRIGAGLTPAVERAVPALVDRARRVLTDWTTRAAVAAPAC